MRIAGIRQRRSGTEARRSSSRPVGAAGGVFEAGWHSCLARPLAMRRGASALVIVDMMAEDYILVKLIITIRIIIYIYYFHDKNDTHHYNYSNIYLLAYEP